MLPVGPDAVGVADVITAQEFSHLRDVVSERIQVVFFVHVHGRAMSAVGVRIVRLSILFNTDGCCRLSDRSHVSLDWSNAG